MVIWSLYWPSQSTKPQKNTTERNHRDLRNNFSTKIASIVRFSYNKYLKIVANEFLCLISQCQIQQQYIYILPSPPWNWKIWINQCQLLSWYSSTQHSVCEISDDEPIFAKYVSPKFKTSPISYMPNRLMLNRRLKSSIYFPTQTLTLLAIIIWPDMLESRVTAF